MSKKHKKKRLIHSDLGTWAFNAHYRMWALAGQPFTVSRAARRTPRSVLPAPG